MPVRGDPSATAHEVQHALRVVTSGRGIIKDATNHGIELCQKLPGIFALCERSDKGVQSLIGAHASIEVNGISAHEQFANTTIEA